MKPSKRFSARLRKLGLSAGILLAFACGPEPFDENEFLSYFMPESSNARRADERYFFTPKLYNTALTDGEDDDTLATDDNIAAWVAYAGAVTDDDVFSVLYETGMAPANPLIIQLSRTHPAAIDYLKLALEADKATGSGTEWNAATTDTTTLRTLLATAQTASQSVSDPFLKERYGFQAVKLAHQIGEFKQATDAYEQLVQPLTPKTFISDWALSRHAGAALALGDTARAIYEFAQVFDRVPSRREAAEISLRKYSIRFRDDALTMAKNNREKSAVLAICAIQPGQEALSFLEQIVALTPDNPLIELIMAREINRNEYYFLNEEIPSYNYGDNFTADSLAFVARKQNAPSYREKLRDFALKSAENKSFSGPNAGSAAFWYTAASYLDYLAKEYAPAQANLDKAAAAPTRNPKLKQQIALQNMLLLAAQTDAPTPEVETRLIGYLEQFGNSTNFRMANAFVKVCSHFADLYRQKADAKSGGFLAGCSRPKASPADDANTAKAFLLTALTSYDLNRSGAYFNTNTDLNAIQDTTAAATIQRVLAYTRQPSPTDFDKRLLTLTRYNPDTLNLLLGRRLMAEHQYGPAADAFAKVAPKLWQQEAFQLYFNRNPFAVKMPGESAKNTYTPVTFARKMADLTAQAATASGEDAAELYYQLGCGAYNLSWYGNAWLVRRSRWSTTDPTPYLLPTDPAKQASMIRAFLADDYITTRQAKLYFGQSLKAARNPDMAARSAFMVARCEENAFLAQRAVEAAKRGYVYDQNDTFDNEMRDLRRKDYATALIDYARNHAKGSFHNQMLRECATYNDFLNYNEGQTKP